MKKLLLFLTTICLVSFASAQNVKESTVKFNKTQVSGYLANINGYTMDVVDLAMRTKLEKEFQLKASKEGSFRAYLNQPCATFGPDSYDIYYQVSEFGKKKNKTTQISFIITKGNMNAITSSTDPDIARRVKNFLDDFLATVPSFAISQQIEALEAELAKLQKEKASLDNEVAKNNKAIAKENKKIEKINKNIEKSQKKIEKLGEKIEKKQVEIDGVQAKIKEAKASR
jgi:valyl-tRNA synthetase